MHSVCPFMSRTVNPREITKCTLLASVQYPVYKCHGHTIVLIVFYCFKGRLIQFNTATQMVVLFLVGLSKIQLYVRCVPIVSHDYFMRRLIQANVAI